MSQLGDGGLENVRVELVGVDLDLVMHDAQLGGDAGEVGCWGGRQLLLQRHPLVLVERNLHPAFENA